jgi:predicted lipase
MDITFDDIMGSFCLAMLIYEYGKKFVIDESQTLQEFMDSYVHPDLNCNETEALNILYKQASDGKVVTFLNDKQTDLQAGITISEEKKTIYVVFRGSESKLDWLYDVQVGKDNLDENIKVHKGFHEQLFDTNAYGILRDILKVVLDIDEHANFNIYVTGHSLGSAEAILFSYFLSDEISNKITLISFASPRVGNNDFAKSLHSKKNLTHYRVSNEKDVVTVFPVTNYYHTGINIRLCCDNNVEIYDEYPSKEFTFFSCWDLREHYCDCYFTRLKKLI